MPRPRSAARAVAALAALALASCGGSDLRKTFPVKGALTVDGKPAPAGVVINLIPPRAPVPMRSAPMKRLLLTAAAVALLGAAAALSGRGQVPLFYGPSAALTVAVEGRNPWTHLRLNNDPGDFHFVIVSDRTGG